MVSSVQCGSDADCVFLLWGCNSLWISLHGWTENKEYYLKVMKRLRRVSEEKKAWFEVEKKWWLHHDNALTHSPFWFVIFSQNIAHPSSLSLHTHQTLHHWTSFSSPSWNLYWKDDDLSPSRKLRKFSGRATHYSKRGIPEMLPKLEEMLGVMYKEWRRVLWRGWCPVAPKYVKKWFV